jgi:hypothetical protein
MPQDEERTPLERWAAIERQYLKELTALIQLGYRLVDEAGDDATDVLTFDLAGRLATVQALVGE